MTPGVYSNFDHRLETGILDDLVTGRLTEVAHLALGFYGKITYNSETKLFTEEIWVLKERVYTVSRSNIRECIDEAILIYGYI